jgi:FkbM family methyltransferase
MVETAAARLGLAVIPSWRLGSLAHATDLQRVFAQLGIDTVLDVGANEGGYRRFLRQQVGFGGRIVSFEPVASVYQRLAADAAGDSNWKGMPIALGDADGELTINVGARTTMSSFLRPDTPRLAGLGYSHLVDVTDVVGTETTPVRRLDGVFTDVVGGRTDPRIFLKCDTQGFDLKVIAGASASLPSIAALQIEMSFKPIYVGAPDCSAVLERMTAAGFDVAGIYPVRRDELLRMVNFDCLMINSRHPAVVNMAPSIRGRTA